MGILCQTLNMRCKPLLLAMLLIAASNAAAQDESADCGSAIYLTGFLEVVDCPTVELALRFIKDNPLAYRIGEPDDNGFYMWYGLDIAINILRQEYAPEVVFSSEEQDALTDELAQLYMYGTEEQSYLARQALQDAAYKKHKYGSGGPYTRSVDVFIEIFETLSAGHSDIFSCSHCPLQISRARTALESIRVHGGQRGEEYAAKAKEPWQRQRAAELERVRRENAHRKQ